MKSNISLVLTKIKQFFGFFCFNENYLFIILSFGLYLYECSVSLRLYRRLFFYRGNFILAIEILKFAVVRVNAAKALKTSSARIMWQATRNWKRISNSNNGKNTKSRVLKMYKNAYCSSSIGKSCFLNNNNKKPFGRFITAGFDFMKYEIRLCRHLRAVANGTI